MKDRSLIKTLSWRIIATLDTFLITWFVTGSLVLGASVISIEVLTKMFLYYAHEKAWIKINSKY